jgi:hypothetical protein
MPVCIGDLADNWNEERESEVFIAFQYGQEVVVFEKAHRSICDLEVWSCDAFDESFE